LTVILFSKRFFLLM